MKSYCDRPNDDAALQRAIQRSDIKNLPPFSYRLQYRGWKTCQTIYEPDTGLNPMHLSRISDLGEMTVAHASWERIATPFVSCLQDRNAMLLWAWKKWMKDLDKRILVIQNHALCKSRFVEAIKLIEELGLLEPLADIMEIAELELRQRFQNEWWHVGTIPARAIVRVENDYPVPLFFPPHDIWRAEGVGDISLVASKPACVRSNRQAAETQNDKSLLDSEVFPGLTRLCKVVRKADVKTAKEPEKAHDDAAVLAERVAGLTV